jgi:multiple sugar transport system permease protein
MQDRVLKYWLIAPALLVIAGTLLYPLASALWYSLHEWKLSESPP